MRNSLFCLLITVVLVLSGCGLNKDAEVNLFITEIDKLTVEIVRLVDESPTAGVDRAQLLLDDRLPRLKASFEKLKNVKGFQISQEMTQKFTNAVAKDVESVNSLQIKYAAETATDKTLEQKLSKLSADFNLIFGV